MRKQQVGNAFGTAAANYAHKDARRHENEDHGNNVFIPDAVAHQLQLGVKESSRFCRQATSRAMRNATTMGIL